MYLGHNVTKTALSVFAMDFFEEFQTPSRLQHFLMVKVRRMVEQRIYFVDESTSDYLVSRNPDSGTVLLRAKDGGPAAPAPRNVWKKRDPASGRCKASEKEEE